MAVSSFIRLSSYGLAWIGLALLPSLNAAAGQQTTMALAFETEAIDLETGQIVALGDPLVDDGGADFHFTYNADRTPHAVLFQAGGAEIARMSATPFAYVTDADVASLVFTGELVDQPFGADDTVVLRTAAGSVYKLGNVLEDVQGGAVVFDYELLQGPQARLAPEAAAASLVAASADSPTGGGASRRDPPAGLGSEAWSAMTRSIVRDLYGVTPVETGDGREEALAAVNPAQAYTTRFTPAGILVRPRGADFEVGLALTAWGYEGALVPASAAPPRADGQRVTYTRGPLEEWYVNRPSGLEQGFTLNEPPPGPRRDAPLRLEMTLSGPLAAVERDGAIVWRVGEGRTRLRYAGLKAWDAKGRVLPAKMVLAKGALALEVDDAEALYPVTIDPTIVNEDAKLLAGDAGQGDQLGRSVTVSGGVVAVGGDGLAYVFERPESGWTGTVNHAAKLSPQADFTFGSTVAVSGSIVVVGAPGFFRPGTAYLFEKPAGGWAGVLPQTATLRASDGASGDRFGIAIAVSEDLVVVGAPGDDDSGSASGSVYVFERPISGWAGTVTQTAKIIVGESGAAGDFFGASVATTGSLLVAGAPLSDQLGTDSGSAYVVEKPAAGWDRAFPNAELLAGDGAALDRFGTSVATSGEIVAVGAPRDDDRGLDSGSAYVFENTGGSWIGSLTHTAKLLGDDEGIGGDRFGESVGVSGDIVVVGAWRNGDLGSESGSAHLFERSPDGNWLVHSKLLASDGETSDRFGVAVAISASTVAVGAPLYDDAGSNSGSAYVFVLGPPDLDGDGIPDDIDNCPATSNSDQLDSDNDGAGDACDACPFDDLNDFDADGVCGDVDNCPTEANAGQSDIDGDAAGDVCDICPADPTDLCDPDGSTAEEILADTGGTVQTPDGTLTVDIDPGDLAADTTVSVTETVVSDPEVDLTIGLNPGLGQALAVYDLQPDGLVFANPVTLTIVLDVSGLNANQRDRLELYLFSDTDGDAVPDSFVPVGAICGVVGDIATCTAEVNHFSLWAAVAPLDTDNDGIPDLFDGLVDVCPAGPNVVNGLLAPLAALVPEEETTVPMPNKAFRLGRTLPLKLDYLCGTVPLTDAAEIAPPEIVAYDRTGEAGPFDTIDPEPGTANDDGVTFRYSDEHWIHNFSTRDLDAGAYVITLELPDGRRFKTGFVLSAP